MNMMRIALVAFLSLAAAAASAASQQRIQCWTDEHGRRACGDSVPPKYSAKERDVLNEQGQVVETKPRAPTDEEIEAAEKAKLDAIERQKQAEHQHAYDRYLLESYQSVHDLEATRDQRLKALEVRIEIVKKAIDTGQQQLDALVARKQQLQKEGKPADKNLEAQLKDYRRTAIENPKALQALQIEHDRVTAQFDADIARYQQLKQVSAAPPPTP